MKGKFIYVILLLIALLLPYSVLGSLPSKADQTPQVLLVAWGSIQQPQNATVGDYNVPLFVVLSGTVINATLLPNSFEPFGTLQPINGVIVSQTATQTVVEFLVSTVASGTFYVPMLVYYTSNNQVKSTTLTLNVYIAPVVYPILESVGNNNGQFFVQGSGITDLVVTLYNPSSYFMRDVEVTLYLPNGMYSIYGTSYVTVVIPQIPPYSLATGSATVNVTEAVQPGKYYESYTLSYTDDLGGRHSIWLTNATIFIIPQQPLKAYISTSVAEPGGLVTVSLELEGQGVVNTIGLSSAFTPVSSNFTLPFSVSGSETVSYQLYVPPTTEPGIYPVSVTLTYTSYGNVYTYVAYGYIYVEPNESTGPEVVSISWTNFPESGGLSTLSFTVFNPFSFPIYNVSIAFDNVSLINEEPVPVIQPLSYGVITATLVFNNFSGSVTLPYTITYYINGNSYRHSSALTLSVYQYPELRINASPSVVFTGTQSVVYLNVTNINKAPIYDLEVSIESNGIQAVYTPSTIASLSPLSHALIPITLTVPLSASPGPYYLLVTASYFFNGENIMQQYYVPIYVAQSNGNLYLELKPDLLYYQVLNGVLLNVTNPLDIPIYNVSLRLIYPQSLLQLSQNTFYIQNIPPHGSYVLNISAFPSQQVNGIITISVIGSYRSGDGLVNYVDANLTLIVTGLIRLEVLSPNFTYSNGVVTFEGVLLNTGNAQANNVILYYPGGSQYIGQVPTGSPLYIQIPAEIVNGSIAKVEMTISYQNQLGQTVNQTYEYAAPYSVPSTTTTTAIHTVTRTLGGLLLIVAIIVVIIVIIKVLRRRR